MKADVTVDVGDNLTSLMERLAQQLGTTVDKVFPWYVEQAYLQGITTLVAIILAFAILVPLFVIAVRKSDFDKGNAWAPVSVASGILLVVSLIFGFLAAPQQVRKIANPKFYAMSMLVDDIGRLRGSGRGQRDD